MAAQNRDIKSADIVFSYYQEHHEWENAIKYKEFYLRIRVNLDQELNYEKIVRDREIEKGGAFLLGELFYKAYEAGKAKTYSQKEKFGNSAKICLSFASEDTDYKETANNILEKLEY